MIASKIYGLTCAYLVNKFILIVVPWVALLQRAPIWHGRTRDMCRLQSLILTKNARLAVLHVLHFKISVNSSENLDKHLGVWYVPAETAVGVELENTFDSTIGKGLY